MESPGINEVIPEEIVYVALTMTRHRQSSVIACAATCRQWRSHIHRIVRKYKINRKQTRIFACYDATCGGHTALVRWLCDIGCPLFMVLDRAAYDGDLEFLKWVHECGSPFGPFSMDHAASGGHTEVIAWMRDCGCKWSGTETYTAAQNGHATCIQWLHRAGAPFNELAATLAIVGGHVDIAQYIVDAGLPFDESVMRAAVRSGPKMLQRVREMCGFPLTRELVALAKTFKNKETVAWLRANME